MTWATVLKLMVLMLFASALVSSVGRTLQNNKASCFRWLCSQLDEDKKKEGQ